MRKWNKEKGEKIIMSDDKVLILIPAKGCSKRVPKKNIRELNGVPLIYYVIKEAFRSGLGDVYVSTEDKKVAEVVMSSSYLERHPRVIIRPKHLAEDPSTVADVALHALEKLEGYDTLIILLPTCPLMKAEDIKNSYYLFTYSNRSPVMSIVPIAQGNSPFRSVLVENSIVRPVMFQKMSHLRNRNFPQCYMSNGCIFIYDVGVFKQERSLYIDSTIGYRMPPERSVDIDTEFDFKMARCLLNDS